MFPKLAWKVSLQEKDSHGAGIETNIGDMARVWSSHTWVQFNPNNCLIQISQDRGQAAFWQGSRGAVRREWREVHNSLYTAPCHLCTPWWRLLYVNNNLIVSHIVLCPIDSTRALTWGAVRLIHYTYPWRLYIPLVFRKTSFLLGLNIYNFHTTPQAGLLEL